ncbi:DUF262 domain-containing protein [Granulicella aggregans]|uniref:DUF262 domain-containing protein n=1 Tax=Granulicella aggregans TaxID=474949 RepID=UPI0021DFBEB1|nr:DUF262 domain-containing HNH endonuclease family protein [Granulicella aggregans]
MKIRSIDRSINDILKGGFYKIPRFQRPYSWEREHVEDFWTDIFVNSGPDYFIGPMVVFKPENSDTSFVVDGQQRLTTITMLLAALRNAFMDANSEDLALGIQSLIERPDINNQSQYCLQTETSYPYFQDHIQSKDAPETEPKIKEEEEALRLTFEYFLSQINKTVAAIQLDKAADPKAITQRIKKKLAELRDKLLSLKVIYIDLDNEDDAYLIFETMNTRGKDLEPADMVKSHLTKLIKPANKNVDITKDFWNKMVETIEGSEADLTVTTYLHHYWLSRYDYVTVKELYKNIKRKVGKSEAKTFLHELVSDSKIYREIQETSYRKWQKSERKIKDSLDALNLFRLKQPLPMVLAIMHAYNAKQLTLSQVQETLSSIEKFHFIFTAITSQRSSGGISFMYALHARNLLQATDSNSRSKVLSELKAKLKDKLPPYEEFEANFTTLNFTNDFTKQKKLIQYVLGRLDRNEMAGVAVDYDQMTIEHLLSQGDGHSPEVYGNIGNLLLCESAFNGKQLATKSFKDKKAILKTSKVTLDASIKSASSWTANEINARAKAMAKRSFSRVWKM